MSPHYVNGRSATRGYTTSRQSMIIKIDDHVHHRIQHRSIWCHQYLRADFSQRWWIQVWQGVDSDHILQIFSLFIRCTHRCLQSLNEYFWGHCENLNLIGYYGTGLNLETFCLDRGRACRFVRIAHSLQWPPRNFRTYISGLFFTNPNGWPKINGWDHPV